MADEDESDEALIARAGRGDRLAASILIARYSPRVLTLCRRLLKNRSAADDAMQETFLKLWEGAGHWNANGGRLDGWLFRVASNACLDRYRQMRRDAPEEEAAEQIDDGPTAVECLSADDTKRKIEEALAALPDNQRIAMTLRHYRDLTNIEIAQAMTISVEAVESLLGRARRSLKDALEGVREELMEAVE